MTEPKTNRLSIMQLVAYTKALPETMRRNKENYKIIRPLKDIWNGNR